MKNWGLIAVLFFMVGGGIGYGIRFFTYHPVRQNGIRAVRQSGFTLTNPLLECEVGDQDSFGEIRLFRGKLQSIVDKIIATKKAGHVSVYFRDLNNGPWMGINEKEAFSPSSLLKVPLMMSVYQLAQQNPKILDTKVLYNGTENKDANQNVKPSIELEPKLEYTYEQLVDRMIIYSDNNAAKLLSQEVKEAAFFRPYDELGIDAPVLQRGEYYLKVKDYATFFRVLFNASYLTREYSEKALGLLLKSEFHDGLVAGVPSGVLVAHKFGERIWEDTKEHQMHDCGIVYFPNNPYLLCVMTRGSDFSSLSTVIRDISKLVYDEIAAQRK